MQKACLVVVALGLFACGGPKGTPPTNTTAKPTASQIEVVAQQEGGPNVEGTVRDAATKEPLAGATIVMSSPALVGEQTTISDEKGRFALSSLPPGKYVMSVYFADNKQEVSFEVAAGKLVKVTLNFDQKASAGEIVTISQEPPPKFANAVAALGKGHMPEAIRLGELELAKQATSKLHATLALARYGAAVDGLMSQGLRGADGGESRVKALRASVGQFLGELDKVQASLEAAAKDQQFSLELCIACMSAEDAHFQFLGTGFLDIERDRTGQPLPEKDPRRRPTFRFDHGDLAWGRAIVSFQQAFFNLTLAYDWEWIETEMASEDTKGPIVIRLIEPARVAKARELLLAGLKFSDEARVAYTNETDDDREWVPSPKQKNYASPLTVDAKLYKTWEDIVGDVRSLVSGDTGISFVAIAKLVNVKDGAPAGFMDIGTMLKSPKDIVIEKGAFDRIESEKNANTRKQLTAKLLKGVLGDGFKTTMKPSRITDRLIQLRQDFDKQGGDAIVEDKLKYFIWLN